MHAAHEEDGYNSDNECEIPHGPTESGRSGTLNNPSHSRRKGAIGATKEDVLENGILFQRYRACAVLEKQLENAGLFEDDLGELTLDQLDTLLYKGPRNDPANLSFILEEDVLPNLFSIDEITPPCMALVLYKPLESFIRCPIPLLEGQYNEAEILTSIEILPQALAVMPSFIAVLPTDLYIQVLLALIAIPSLDLVQFEHPSPPYVPSSPDLWYNYSAFPVPLSRTDTEEIRQAPKDIPIIKGLSKSNITKPVSKIGKFFKNLIRNKKLDPASLSCLEEGAAPNLFAIDETAPPCMALVPYKPLESFISCPIALLEEQYNKAEIITSIEILPQALAVMTSFIVVLPKDLYVQALLALLAIHSFDLVGFECASPCYEPNSILSPVLSPPAFPVPLSPTDTEEIGYVPKDIPIIKGALKSKIKKALKKIEKFFKKLIRNKK